jgi:type II secretory pathway component PulF
MRLKYTAFDRTGRKVVDSIDAASRAAASERLRRDGLYVAEIAEQGGRQDSAEPRPTVARAAAGRLKPLAAMLQQLHILVAGGTPLVKALSSIEKQARSASWRRAAADVRRHVEEGAALSAAMESHPEYFDAFCRSLIAAGESSGDLGSMLKRLAATTRAQLHLRQTLVGAMIYPVLLITIALSVLVVLLVVAIPKFGEMFRTLDAPVPPVTAAMISFGVWLQSYWYVAAAAIAAVVAGVWAWARSAAGRRCFDRLVLRLPLVGRLTRSLITARITRILGVLLDGNVPVLDALALAQGSINNHCYAGLLAQATESVRQGERMSDAFDNETLIAPSTCEAIRTGEETAQVGPMMLMVADFLEQENELTTRSLTSIIEPVILIAMGGLVAFVAFSMFLPLFDLISSAGGG